MAYQALKVSRSPEETCNIGEGIDRSFTARWDVVLNASASESQNISPLQVYYGIPGLPQYGNPWTSYDGQIVDYMATLRTFTGKRDHNEKNQFSFTFNYNTRASERGRLVNPSNPGDRFQNTGNTDDVTKLLPVWTIDFEDRMVPSRTDLDGLVVQNSAGDPFDPLPEYNDPILVLNYSKYIAFDISTAAATTETLINLQVQKFATNADLFLLGNAFATDDTNCWVVWDVKITPELIGMQRVFRRDLVLKYSTTGWRADIDDFGLYELITPAADFPPTVGNYTAANRRPIISPLTRQPVTKPWPMDGTGSAITDLANRPYRHRYRLKQRINFSTLGVVLA